MKLLLVVLCLVALCASGADATAADTAASSESADMERAVAQQEDGLMMPLAAVPVNDALETSKNALAALQSFVDIFNSDIFEKTPVKIVAEIISKVMSFVVSILSLIQDKPESAEINYMREQFTVVHTRLDRISLPLDDVKSLIGWGTARVMYAEYEIFITTTSHLLDNYVAAPASEREVRKRMFVTAIQSKRLAALKLYHAIVETDFVIADNLAAAVVHYTKNHRRQVMSFLLAMNRVILRGAQLEIAYERLEHGVAAGKLLEADWKTRMGRLITRMHAVETQVKDGWHTQMQSDVSRFLLEQSALSNQNFVCPMHNFLADKYDWRHWFSLAYNEVTGGHLHTVYYCAGAHHFRTHGRNMVVASSDKKTSQFSQGLGDKVLELAESSGSRTNNAEVRVGEIYAKLTSYFGNRVCDVSSFWGAVCWGCNVWFCSSPERRSYRITTVGGNLHTMVFG